MKKNNLFFEEKAQGEWSGLYLLIVFAIAALLVLTVVKPMFKQSQQVVASKVPINAQSK